MKPATPPDVDVTDCPFTFSLLLVSGVFLNGVEFALNGAMGSSASILDSVRGYDTQGLFWYDMLLRTRNSDGRGEAPREYLDITALLVETARQQGWHSQS
jgi:hypothetical protein